MGPVAVVVLDVLVDDSFEMSTTEDEHPVQTFTPDSTDEALGEGVCSGRSDRSSNGPDALGAEHLVEAGRELGVAIADQELDRLCTLGELIGQIPGLLGHPGTRRMRRHSRHIRPAGIELDEEKDVEPPQEHSEEIAGQHRRSLSSQELGPCRSGSLWGGVDAMTLENVPNACWCQVDAQDSQLPLDPAIAPHRILHGQTNDELHSACGDPRTTGGLRLGPLATDQITMPPEQRLRLHEERPPTSSIKQPTQPGEQRTVSGSQSRPDDLTTEDGHLVAEDD